MNSCSPIGKVECLICQMSLIICQENDFDCCLCSNQTYIYWNTNTSTCIEYGGKNRAFVVLLQIPYNTETMEYLEVKYS